MKKKNGLAIAAVVIGVLGIGLSFVPIINNAAFIFGIIAIVLGVISLFRHASKALVIAAIVLGVGTCGFTLMLQDSWSNSLDEATGDATDKVLENYLDVKLGKFTVKKDEYGYAETKLVVKVTNKTDDKLSFDIKIEAVDKDGNRLDDDSVFGSDLGAGQSQEFETFTYIEEDKLDKMKNAEFRIVEASKY